MSTLRKHLESQTYDKYYQDIECLNFIGYAKSYITWNNIKDLVNWKDKWVLDVGCFHGYYCFKAEQEGALAITGIDKNNATLVTTRMIGEEYKSKCLFQVLNANSALPGCDILLCLNVFHHIPDKDAFLKNILAKQIIFEVDKEDLPKIEEYCNIIVKKDSHRASAYTGDTPNRLVLLAEKKQ
jgi:2-polyprenyl-3-methyl-5-hydroxy-6-metoxy-1,4-benzoquinol methylase